MVELSIKIVWVFAFIFCVFEFGERLTCGFEEINDVYDQCSWYLFPCKAQQMLIMLLKIAQKPVELRVFGSTSHSKMVESHSKMLATMQYSENIKMLVTENIN